MKLPDRQFTARPAVRERVPLLIGLMGPSGGGKTYTALRLATGIQQVVGGEIFVIDTESRRALHYAEQFEFKHVQFDAPFGSLDYLAALEYCAKQNSAGGGVIIVDSMSHEHEGPGGLLDLWESEIERMSGGDWKKAERIKMLAIQKPKKDRRALITRLLQMNYNFIFCFRAKETAKPVRNAEGKTEVQQLGFMPIAGDEFVFEMTMNCLLLPNAKGVPTWRSDEIGERKMMKLPRQFEYIFARGDVQLDEKIGEQLAQWAAGNVKGDASQVAAAKPAATSNNTQSVTKPQDRIDPLILVDCKTDQCPKCANTVGFAKDPASGKTRAYNKNGDWHIPKCGQPTGWDEMPPPATGDDDEKLDDPFAPDGNGEEMTDADKQAILEMEAREAAGS